jgi:capsular polysaccharide transport system permease protein
MSDQPSNYHGEDTSTALDYSRDVAKRLSVTARKLRLATSNRSDLFKAVGLRPRMIDRVFAGAVIAATLFLFIIPNVTSIAYYGFIAADQYESEARFTVRTSSPAIGKDQLAKVTGLPSSKIVQDTQIVTNYIDSNEMLADVSKHIDLKGIYRAQDADSFARLKPDATNEEFLKYWKHMVTTAISPSSGIVTVKVKAFSAEDSRKVLQEVVSASERVVNGVNDRIWKDVIQTAQSNLENSAAQLQDAREKLQVARNKSGVLTVDSTSTVISTLLGTAQQEMLELQQRYTSALASSVSKAAPQMKVLQREIASKQAQIDNLKAEIAGSTTGASSSQPNLADISLDLSQLEMNQGLAERQFAASVRTVEQVNFISKQQLVYLDSFLSATLPDAAEYPRRGLWIGCTFIATLALWAAAIGLLSVLKSRMN